MTADDAAPPAPSDIAGLDPDSRQWLDRLRSTGSDQADAVGALFELLHRGARSEAYRRRGSLPAHVAGELDDIARQAADDALAAVLRKLADYRGASRFTTWAWKFAVFEVSAMLRREAWRGRSITIDAAAWARLGDDAPTDPHAEAEARDLLAAIQRAVTADLTDRQREVFTAIVVRGVPVDAVADRNGSTRGATYKILHDARQKLRASLAAQGWHEAGGGRAS